MSSAAFRYIHENIGEKWLTCICTLTTSEGTSQRLPVMSPRIAAAQKVTACGTS